MGRAAQDQRKTAKQKRQSAFKRATGGNSFSALRKDLVLSGEFKALSGSAVKVLNVLMVLYNGSNNGDLSAPLSQSETLFGMTKKTLQKALNELVDKGFIEISRQGNRKQCALFALTFYSIDRIENKFLMTAPTHSPKDLWKINGK